jgi:hypothetical protein
MNMLSQQKIKNSFSFLSVLMATLILLLSVNVHGYEKESLAINNAQHVKFNASADDDFLLTADYYAGEKKAGGAIILHDCKSDRSRYSKMADGLSQQGLHTLALDLRGYGGSISEKYSRDIIKKNATDIVGYHSEMALLTTYWQDDLIAAYQFLRSSG